MSLSTVLVSSSLVGRLTQFVFSKLIHPGDSIIFSSVSFKPTKFRSVIWPFSASKSACNFSIFFRFYSCEFQSPQQ